MSDAIRELTVGINFNEIDLSRLLRMDRAIDSVEQNVRDLGGDLNRLGSRADEAGTEGSRAMDRLGRHTDGAGDAMDELGRDAARAGDRTERAARDAMRDIDRLGREADGAMDEMRDGADRASDAIRDTGNQGDRAGDDIRASSDRAADALRDMGNAGERAAGDIIRAGGRADSEIDELGDSARRTGDAIDELGSDASELNRLIQSLDNINGKLELQRRKLRTLRSELDETFDRAGRDRLMGQILNAESAMLRLTRQSDRTAREINELEDAMRDAGNRADRTGRQGSDAMDEIRRGAEGARDAIDEVGDATQEAGEDGARGGGRILDVLNQIVPQGRIAGAASALLSNPWVIAAAAVVAAIGGIGIAIMGMVNDAESDFKRLQAQLGYTEAQMSGVKGTVLDVFEQGFGESIRDVGDNVATLRQSFKDLGDEGIANIAKGAYTLKDLFGPEVKETSKAIKTMTANFDGLSEQDAMDLITTGFQKGGDYANDFIDTVNEYSVYFDKLGVSAEKFIGTLISGGQAGAFNLDKVGDSFKELSIRAIDGSDTTVDAFKTLGFDAKKMGRDFGAGGKTAENALMATVSALSFVDDAQERNRIGVELFGTQWEDMRENVIFSIDGAEKAVEGFEGATERATATMQDTVGTKWTQITRQFKTGIIEAFDGSGGAMTGLLDKILQVMPQVQAGIQSAVDWINSVFAENKEEIGAFTQGVAGFFTGLWNTIQGIWFLLGPLITGVFSDALGVVFEVAGEVLGAVGNVFSIFGNLIQGNWGEAWQSVKDLFSGVLNGVLNIGRSVLNLVFGVFDNTLGRVINLFTNFSLKEHGMNIVNGLIEGIKSMAGSAVDAIGNVASGMWNKVKDFFGIASPSKLFTDAGKWIIEGLTNGIKNMGSKAVNSIKDVASNIWGGVKDFFGINSPSRLMTDAGGFIVEGLEVGIDKTAVDAVAAAKDLAKGMEAAATIEPLQAKLGASDAAIQLDKPEPLELAVPKIDPLQVDVPKLDALEVNMPEVPKVKESPEVTAIVQPEPQKQPEQETTTTQTGAPTPSRDDAPSLADAATPAATLPPLQITFGNIMVQMPEGATQKEAQEFGGNIAQEVRQQLASLFTQLGIALP